MKTLGEENYEQFAHRYAERLPTKPHNAYYDRPAVLSLLPDVCGKRVLDAGCGPGVYTEILLERGAEVVAVDVTPDFVALAQERVGNRATVLRADLQQPLDFAPDGSFDVVVCALVLVYMTTLNATLQEFYRVLKPGGVLVTSSEHPLLSWRFCEDGDYFTTQQTAVYWDSFGEPKPLIKGYHRPLQHLLNPVIQSGFRLDHILEPQPTDAFRQADPHYYATLMREPGFLCIRAIKE